MQRATRFPLLGTSVLILVIFALMPMLTAAQAVMLEPGPAMLHPRAAHTATPLADGWVLVAGGCTKESCELTADGATTELFDPARNLFIAGPVLETPRVSHAASPLPDGRVLLLGGWTPEGPTASTEIFDPAANTVLPGAEMTFARADAAVALLPDGRVLVVGGYDGDAPLASAEIYDPATNTFAPASDMTTPRTSHASVTMVDGNVLIIGGSDREDHVVGSAEIFDIETETFEPTGSMAEARYKFGAVLLDNGHVLVAAGTDERDASGALASTEIYDPASGEFRNGPPLHQSRFKIANSLVALPNDAVLIAGGADEMELLTRTRSERLEPPLGAALSFLTASPLSDGRVLVAGGYDSSLVISSRTWLFQPG